MPPKVKITKEDITNTALELIRENGETALNARSIASALGCSTQPVFSNFETMEELRGEVNAAAYELYLGYLKRESESGRYPKYKAFGMAYTRFAKEEKELFKFLFMRDRTGEDMSPSPDFNESVQLIMSANGVSAETARLIHLELWSLVHGIGTMFATSFLELDESLVSTMITNVYQGICAHLKEDIKI